MTVSALIQTFAQWEKVPIDIEDHVKPEFLKLGVKDEVYFWSDPKLNPGIIRGVIEHWEYPVGPSGPTKYCADITYAEQLPHDWQRLVCCKELLHILDPVETRHTKPEDIHRLIEKIILPVDLRDPLNDGIHANTDRVADAYATAVLFPLRAREILWKPYNEKKLLIPKIANLTELPVRYVALVMNELWPEIHERLVAIGARRIGTTATELSPEGVPIGTEIWSDKVPKPFEYLVDRLIRDNPEKVEQAKAKPTLIGWFVDQAMRELKGRADPHELSARFRLKLGL